MSDVRKATPDDVEMLARIHVTAWRETYPGLIPEAEIAARDMKVRRKQWTNQIARGQSRIAVVPDLGFAQAGPQRDAALRDAGISQELYAIYLLRSGQRRGLGRALLAAVTDPEAGPMSALVVDGNDAAIAFYRATGARCRDTRNDWIGAAPTLEHAYVWDDPRVIVAD